MRQSNGSNFFLNRKDTIVIKGYLNKKSVFFVELASFMLSPKVELSTKDLLVLENKTDFY